MNDNFSYLKIGTKIKVANGIVEVVPRQKNNCYDCLAQAHIDNINSSICLVVKKLFGEYWKDFRPDNTSVQFVLTQETP